MENELSQQIAAVRRATEIGCFGAHQIAGGEWMPCSSTKQFLSITMGESVKSRLSIDDMRQWSSVRKAKGKKRKKRWEKLRERRILGIDSLPNGGLVSGNSRTSANAISGGNIPPMTNGANVSSGMSTKSIHDSYSSTDNDSYLFTDVYEKGLGQTIGSPQTGNSASQQRDGDGDGYVASTPGGPDDTRAPAKNTNKKPPKGQVVKGNINLNNRPVVKNKDGSISTVRSISMTEDKLTVLIPTVIRNQDGTGKIVSDREAWRHYKRTGEHLGKFSNPKDADTYAMNLSKEQAAQYLPRGRTSPSRMSAKSIQPAYMPRDNDPDVFVDIESARKRSRQLGCIGVSRRLSKGGKTVWMPCTNLTDYNNLTGMTSLGRLNQGKRNDRVVRTIIKDELKKRKKSISEEILGKALGPRLRGIGRAATSRFDPKAIDGDEDGLLQDGTQFERPNVPNANIPSRPEPAVSAEKDVEPKSIASIKKWISSLTPEEKEDFRSEPIEAFDAVPGLASRSVFRRGKTEPQSMPEPPKKVSIEGLNNPEASPTNPFRNLGGRAISQIIRGLVDPKNKNKKDRKTYIVGGNTGSGKSTVLDYHLIPKGLVPSESEAALIDPDFVKKALPGYDDGAGAGKVHGQSQTVTDKIIKDSASDGMDMVITGSGASRQLTHIREANNRGESVIGHWVHIPQSKASQRIRTRMNKNGRYIPDNTAHMAASIPRTISAAFEEDLLEEFYLWDNDVPEGSPPKLIAKKVRGSKFEIFDKPKFEEFAGDKKWADKWVDTADDREERMQGLASYTGQDAWNALEQMGFVVDYGKNKDTPNVKVRLPKDSPVSEFYKKFVLPYMIDKTGRMNAHKSRGYKDGEVLINALLISVGIDVDRKKLTDKNNIKKFKKLLASSDPKVLAELFARAPINGPNGESRFGDLNVGGSAIEVGKTTLDDIAEKIGVSESQISRLISEGFTQEELSKMSKIEIEELLEMIE
jgi:predicted ABC-type ATPase